MYITAQGCRLWNDLYCVEWDVKLYYTIPYHTNHLMHLAKTPRFSFQCWFWVPCKCLYYYYYYFMMLCVSTVFAVAHCPSVCPSVHHAQWNVSTRLTISSNFFLSWVAPSFYFFDPSTGTQFQWNSFSNGANKRGWKNLAIFDRNCRLSPNGTR